MTSQLLRIDKASKAYGATIALDSVDLDVEPGSIVGLIGENGCGKSTFLKAVAGLVRLDSGEVRVCGELVGPRSKSMVSYLPDRSALPARFTVESCMRVFGQVFADFDEAKARAILKNFGIEPTRRLHELSKGQQEKAHIALAMARDARLFLLDEPISGVDPLSREQTLREVIAALGDDCSLLITSHMVQDLELIVDRALLMRRGQIVDDVCPDELREQTGDGLVERLRKVYGYEHTRR
ncbi:ABC transporter ATP-binding protein [Dermabacter hominis]|uniref:ABC transporter ATP-binding protein n=1 Tax=Dermabacter hominis TaxID=36740 RepID=UPI00242CADAF|nr:ABC transporter ATP-binding protein [Dermabacter hominis]